MNDRMLVMLKEEYIGNDVNIIGRRPAVLEAYDEDDSVMRRYPTMYLEKATENNEIVVKVLLASGGRTFPILDEADFKINAAKGNITFKSYGRIYTVRAYQDSDGLWASALGTAVPAKALEDMYIKEEDMAFSPNAPKQEENLYAAVDSQTGEVKELVYSYTGGMYTRSSEGWFKVPNGDESLDGLEILEVDPSFIKVFDRAQAAEKMLKSKDITKYEVAYRDAQPMRLEKSTND
jgi:hypothetical protein